LKGINVATYTLELTPEQFRELSKHVMDTVQKKRFNSSEKLQQWLNVWYPIKDAFFTAKKVD